MQVIIIIISWTQLLLPIMCQCMVIRLKTKYYIFLLSCRLYYHATSITIAIYISSYKVVSDEMHSKYLMILLFFYYFISIFKSNQVKSLFFKKKKQKQKQGWQR